MSNLLLATATISLGVVAELVEHKRVTLHHNVAVFSSSSQRTPSMQHFSAFSRLREKARDEGGDTEMFVEIIVFADDNGEALKSSPSSLTFAYATGRRKCGGAALLVLAQRAHERVP